MAGERRAEEVAQRAVRRVNPCAGARRVGFDVRGGVGAGGVESRVGPGGGGGQRQLQPCRQQPEHAHSVHATPAFRAAHATTSSSPYMQTIKGPVGRSALYETDLPTGPLIVCMYGLLLVVAIKGPVGRSALYETHRPPH